MPLYVRIDCSVGRGSRLPEQQVHKGASRTRAHRRLGLRVAASLGTASSWRHSHMSEAWLRSPSPASTQHTQNPNGASPQLRGGRCTRVYTRPAKKPPWERIKHRAFGQAVFPYERVKSPRGVSSTTLNLFAANPFGSCRIGFGFVW